MEASATVLWTGDATARDETKSGDMNKIQEISIMSTPTNVSPSPKTRSISSWANVSWKVKDKYGICIWTKRKQYLGLSSDNFISLDDSIECNERKQDQKSRKRLLKQ